ncbi:MAG: FAD:protein FMN transferase [Candidatus Nanopelagicales bacterium]
MGTIASLVIPTDADGSGPAVEVAAPAADAARAWLDEVELVLSPFLPNSHLCRWRCGGLPIDECSPMLREVAHDAVELEDLTHGGFTPYDRRGRFDPTGYVKGWAVQRAVGIVRSAGVPNVCLGVGGDIQTAGYARDGRPWRVAVVDPGDPHKVLSIVEAPGPDAFAVATSGTSQRGEHIWGPRDRRVRGRLSQRPALASVTVFGSDLGLADAFATAVWAHGRHRPLDEAWSWLAGTGYHALAVAADGSLTGTPGASEHLIRPGRPRDQVSRLAR